MADNSDLRFQVAPHIVQDLGLNLYTSLPRVLVEFVANAYDADSPTAQITMDRALIQAERAKVKADWKLKKERETVAEGNGETIDPSKQLPPLELMTLPESVKIIVQDNGHGMTREDLQEKFLIAGRRRRQVDKTDRTPGGRLVMGRKGLGKLAGFGVAHTVEVISRKTGAPTATSITMEFNEIIKHTVANEVFVPTKVIDDSAVLPNGGTMIVLSKLVYGPMKSTEETILNAIGDHFALLDPQEFKVSLGNAAVVPTPRQFAFAYPNETLPHDDLVSKTLQVEDDEAVTFRYRLRFTGPSQQLNAADQGMRIYAHKRLAAAPSTLDLKTGVHGFRNVHYLDGVVYADFLDDQPVDYIATDRQNLRWDSALLAPLRAFLTKEMEDACNAYQKERDEKAEDAVKNDPFTQAQINQADLPKYRKKLALKIAKMLSTYCENGIAGEEYKTNFPILVDGLAHGDLLRSLADLATEAKPKFSSLLSEVSRLTAHELGDFMRVVQGRLNGIQAFKKIAENADFKKPDNEKELHKLLEDCPWLIDPLFSQLVTSNRTEEVMQQRLAKHLEIGGNVPTNYDPKTEEETKEFAKNERPDLVFLLGNDNLKKVVIVELKAPNTPLHLEHLTQLKKYMRKAKEWLKEHDRADTEVLGMLIGSKAAPQSRGESVQALREEIRENMENAKWKVFDILELVKRAETAHQEFLEVHKDQDEDSDE